MNETHVVTVFLRNGTDVLLLKRSDEVGSYPRQWGGVAGHVGRDNGAEQALEQSTGERNRSQDPAAAAREEIHEETGLGDAVVPVRAGEPFPVDDPEHGRWVVHPFLFDCDSRDVETDWETAAYEWVPPTEILRRETVPDLWTSYERVAPTVETVAGETKHGSAYISVRALEVLRDRAAALAAGRADPRGGEWADLSDLARTLLEARPGMQAVANRVNRAMAVAADRRTAAAVEAAASDTIARALDAGEQAAANAADRVGRCVLTLSRSGTVMETLRQAGPEAVLVAESRPAREGVDIAEELAGVIDAEVSVFVDAAVAHMLATRAIETVLVGADAVLANGQVVNKVGTRAAALASAREGVPIYVVAAKDKVAPTAEPDLETGAPDEVYEGDAALTALNPTFDVTPADLLAGVVTEDGLLDADDVAEAANEVAALADWDG